MVRSISWTVLLLEVPRDFVSLQPGISECLDFGAHPIAGWKATYAALGNP
jgi:hypothetical protein